MSVFALHGKNGRRIAILDGTAPHMTDPELPGAVGEIVNVCVDERVLDENGNVDVSKAQPITFDPFNNTYVVLGEAVAKAFSAGNSLK